MFAVDRNRVTPFDGLDSIGGSRDRTTRLWDARTCQQLASWEDHDTDVRAVAFTGRKPRRHEK